MIKTHFALLRRDRLGMLLFLSLAVAVISAVVLLLAGRS